MSFQRYGSMQSIPEHEPTQSEVLNDEGDPHYKVSPYPCTGCIICYWKSANPNMCSICMMFVGDFTL